MDYKVSYEELRDVWFAIEAAFKEDRHRLSENTVCVFEDVLKMCNWTIDEWNLVVKEAP